MSGRVRLGRVHISAGEPWHLSEDDGILSDVHQVSREIQERQQSMIAFSDYHATSTAAALNMDKNQAARALLGLGCSPWPKSTHSELALDEQSVNSPTELWSILLQFGHLIAPMLNDSHSSWAKWLSPAGLLRSNV